MGKYKDKIFFVVVRKNQPILVTFGEYRLMSPQLMISLQETTEDFIDPEEWMDSKMFCISFEFQKHKVTWINVIGHTYTLFSSEEHCPQDDFLQISQPLIESLRRNLPGKL